MGERLICWELSDTSLKRKPMLRNRHFPQAPSDWAYIWISPEKTRQALCNEERHCISVDVPSSRDRISPTANVRKQGQCEAFVLFYRNGLTKPDTLLSYLYRESLIARICADWGKRIGTRLSKTTLKSLAAIAAHAHHEPAIARVSALQLIACVTVFGIYKLACDRHASVRVIAKSKSFSVVFTYA
jgi:hypothetical protein